MKKGIDTMKREGEKYDRQTVLDLLKGICIIFVIITHYSWNHEQRLIGLFPYFIDMAVPIFMIISGYVFSISYTKKGVHHFEDAYDLVIIANRILRYTIPFLMAYALELVFLNLTGSKIGFIRILTGFFTGGFGPGSYYYPEMIQITFFLPVILFSMKKNPNVGLAFWFLFNAFYEFIKTVVGLDQRIYRLSLFRYTFLVAFGCFMYLKKGQKINKAIAGGSFFVGFIYILITKYFGYHTHIINNHWRGTSFMAALYIAPIIMFIVSKFGAVSFKPIEVIGKASYNVFLTQLVYYSLEVGIITKWTDNIALHVIFNVVVCVLAGLVFYLIEDKITRKIIQWIDPLLNRAKKCLNQQNAQTTFN